MQPRSLKKGYVSLVEQACVGVPGFRDSYQQFHQKAVIEQSSSSFVENYGRNAATLALHFGVSPEHLAAEEINAYLYRLATNDTYGESYFKFTVYGMRYWFRLFGMNYKALRMPVIKEKNSLPSVLSKEECKELFHAPRMFKHKIMLTLAYSGGLRLNELRHLRIADVDFDRMMIHIKQGKGNKDRYVVLSKVMKQALQQYYAEYKPQVYVFNGETVGEVVGERTIQNAIKEALLKTKIQKIVTMHTLRHSYATHLLEDGVDLITIKNLLGHGDIRTTMIYLHVAQFPTGRKVHSPLDSLYGRL